MEYWQLQQRQSLPLEAKIIMTKRRIREWYEHWYGDVYVSFSGGKDSTVLLDLVRSMYPEVVAVYSDTGLEFPEIRDFVKQTDNVIWLKPEMNFRQVIKQHGYPVISKEIACTIEYGRLGSQWAVKRLNGEHNFGNHKKYKYLLDAPFSISDKCCNEMKKKPFKTFEKKTGLKPFIGTMASEGGQRISGYIRTGCNAFNSKNPKSNPLGFWKEEDIWEYINTFNVPYSKIYNMGYHRTGCMFCMFGAHLEGHPNRFQKMAITHPKQYKYCIENLKLGEILDYLEIPYRLYENNVTGVMKKDATGELYEQLNFGLQQKGERE